MISTNQLLPTFSLVVATQPHAELTLSINKAHQECLKNPTTALLLARKIGQSLLELQQQMSSNQWQTWLEESCQFSLQTAQTYIIIAQNWPALELNYPPALPPAPSEKSLALLPFKIEAETWENPAAEVQTMSATLEVKNDIIEEKNRDKLTFFIPGPVVPKARPRVTQHGTFMPPRYKAWRNFAEVELHRQINEKINLPVLPIPYAAVKVRLIGKHRMNADADNIIGSLLDALVAVGVFKNDNLSYIPEIAFKLINEGSQGAHITIIPL